MKALVQDAYGEPGEVLRIEEVDRPAIARGEVLARVQAASVHIGDCHVVRGVPYAMRPVFGLRRPKERIPGTDMAGTVEAVGPGVTSVTPGDAVFGWCKGAFAEFAAVKQEALAHKPAEVTFEQAAAVGVSAFTALQALRDHGKVRSGQKVLITGASGGVGTFAVQVAKAFGAEVTAVCSTRNVDMVRSIGADHVIDYTQADYTRGEDRYDLILDNVGAGSLSAMRRALTPDGLLLPNGARVGGWFGGLGHVAGAFVSSLFIRGQGRPFVSMPNSTDLEALRGLLEDGRIRPVIDRMYPLDDGAAAVAHVAQGHAQGKTVITM